MFLIAVYYLLYLISVCLANSHPNIIMIVADDLGWNDVGFHGSNQIPTPNIDALAYSGIILNNYYTLQLCTPSRAALMTGRHSIKTGMQHNVIVANEPWGLSLKEKLLPQYLKELNYSTHAIGKWHLGFFKRIYTPLYRGFDSHYGYWTSHQDYYDHTLLEDYWGFDMREGLNSTPQDAGSYTTTLLTEAALSLVAKHDVSKPLFLYMSHLAVHVGSIYHPLQAPQEVVDLFPHIEDQKRRTYAAMLTMLDWSVGALVAALESRGMLENSIILFTTDNGGSAGGYDGSAASNWPLRGVKATVWEGGVRGVACIWSPLLQQKSKVFNQLAHIQDWLPTILGAVNASRLLWGKQIDGKNIWKALNEPNIRTYNDLLINIDDIKGYYALRSGKWKLLKGTSENGTYDHVFEPSGRDGQYDWEKVQSSIVARALANTTRSLPNESIVKRLRSKATLSCDQKNDNLSLLCNAAEGEICLFDVVSDPCESRNVAKRHPSVVKFLLQKLAMYNKTAIPPRNQPIDPASNPKYWNNRWNNWGDYPPPLDLMSQQ